MLSKSRHTTIPFLSITHRIRALLVMATKTIQYCTVIMMVILVSDYSKNKAYNTCLLFFYSWPIEKFIYIFKNNYMCFKINVSLHFVETSKCTFVLQFSRIGLKFCDKYFAERCWSFKYLNRILRYYSKCLCSEF